MSANIERLRKHYSRLARRDHRMAHVAKQLEVARNLNDEFDGPVEIFSADVDAPHQSLRYETPEDRSFTRESEALQWKKDIIDFFLGHKDLISKRPFEWNEIARLFNEHFGSRLTGQIKLSDLTIPNTQDRWTASQSWIAKARRIDPKFKSGFNSRLSNLNRALDGGLFYRYRDVPYFDQPSKTLADFRRAPDDKLIRQRGMSIDAVRYDRILLAPRVARTQVRQGHASRSRR